MDLGEFVVKPLKDFSKNSIRLVKRCTKPDQKGERGIGCEVSCGAARSRAMPDAPLAPGARGCPLARRWP